MEDVSRDEEILAAPEEKKPDPPGEFDPVQVRAEVSLFHKNYLARLFNVLIFQLDSKARLCRRPPGETKIVLELSQNGTVDKEVQDNRETSRRHAAQKMKVFVKIFFNGKEVCQTSAKPLGDEFSVPVAQIFPLQITQWPESLKIKVTRHQNGLDNGQFINLSNQFKGHRGNRSHCTKTGSELRQLSNM